jgi:hypothetical protein
VFHMLKCGLRYLRFGGYKDIYSLRYLLLYVYGRDSCEGKCAWA